jgi:hypothetical protein
MARALETHSVCPQHLKASTPPLLHSISDNIISSMATQTAPSDVCVVCSQPDATRCTGCADTEHTGTEGATRYCSKTCQKAHWKKHKAACQSAQGRKKLFRAAELIQETFFALKAEVFDLNVTKVERAEDGKLDFYDLPFKGHALYGASAACLDAVSNSKRAVLSYRAGGDVFADGFYDLVVAAFKGDFTPGKTCAAVMY